MRSLSGYGTTGLVTGLVLASAVGLLSYLATLRTIEHDARARFITDARNAQNAIGARIGSYTNLLRGAAALFSASESVTRSEFHDYVAGLDLPRNYPAIETINFAQYVARQDLAAFDREMRAEAAAAGQDPRQYRLRPPGDRPEYCVLKYVEPGNIWWATFGLDLAVQEQAHEVMLQSRDTGKMITSGRPIAAISRPNRIGLGMRLPLYRPGLPLDTVRQRRAAYVGSVGVAFSVFRLVDGVRDEMPGKDVRMRLVDTEFRWPDGRVGQTLFDSAGSKADPAPPLLDLDRKYVVTLPIDFNGRRWEVTFSADKHAMHAASDSYFPLIAAAGGFLTTALLYMLYYTMSQARRKAVELARSMTRDLRESKIELQASHQALRELSAHGEKIKECERKRIAREIHDDLGQNLLALRIEADMLCSRTRGRQRRLHARACATRAQIDATIQSVRSIINDLRPNVLDLGLSAAVEWQMREFEHRTGIMCELNDRLDEALLDDHRATALFRVLQESLNNILRHSHASAVRVELTCSLHQLHMTIADNGVGFDNKRRRRVGSFGLMGIEERMNILGGRSSIVSTPAVGTTVAVSLPLRGAPVCPPPASRRRIPDTSAA